MAIVEPADQCCCGCTLKTGVKILGWLGIVSSICTLVTGILVGVVLMHSFEKNPRDQPISPEVAAAEKMLIFGLVFFGIAFIVQVTFSICTLMAAHKESLEHAKTAWYLAAIGFFFNLLSLFTSHGLFATVVQICFSGYSAYIIWSYKEALRLHLPSIMGPGGDPFAHQRLPGHVPGHNVAF